MKANIINKFDIVYSLIWKYWNLNARNTTIPVIYLLLQSSELMLVEKKNHNSIGVDMWKKSTSGILVFIQRLFILFVLFVFYHFFPFSWVSELKYIVWCMRAVTILNEMKNSLFISTDFFVYLCSMIDAIEHRCRICTERILNICPCSFEYLIHSSVSY